MGQKYVTIAEETLAMAGVGVWTVEMDPGKEPRLYADKVMKRLIGSEGEVTAEEDYHKWYAGVVPEFLKPVLQYVQNIVDTGRDQIVYPWDYPDEALMTLCNNCHIKAHKKYKIKTYFTKCR